MASSTLLDDRRDAVRALKALSKVSTGYLKAFLEFLVGVPERVSAFFFRRSSLRGPWGFLGLLADSWEELPKGNLRCLQGWLDVLLVALFGLGAACCQLHVFSSQKYRLEVGIQAMEHLVHVLQTDR